MPERAHVTSTDAIEDFRNKLVIYLSKARPSLEEVSADVARTRSWLENDQRVHWEGQVRRHTKALEQAQQALFSSRVSALKEETGAEQLAVQRAKRALDAAQEKLKRLKQWNRDFASRVEPLVKQMDKLHTLLSNDMLVAVAHLGELIKMLEAYADMTPDYGASSPAPASATPPAGSAGAPPAGTGPFAEQPPPAAGGQP